MKLKINPNKIIISLGVSMGTFFLVACGTQPSIQNKETTKTFQNSQVFELLLGDGCTYQDENFPEGPKRPSHLTSAYNPALGKLELNWQDNNHSNTSSFGNEMNMPLLSYENEVNLDTGEVKPLLIGLHGNDPDRTSYSYNMHSPDDNIGTETKIELGISYTFITKNTPNNPSEIYETTSYACPSYYIDYGPLNFKGVSHLGKTRLEWSNTYMFHKYFELSWVDSTENYIDTFYIPKSDSSFVHPDIEEGHMYTYKIRAVYAGNGYNGAIYSPWSKEVSLRGSRSDKIPPQLDL